jgi:hypothetical protein
MLPAFEKWFEGNNGMSYLSVSYHFIFPFILRDLLEKHILCILMPPVAFELTGLGRGGQQVQKCKETFSKAMEALVDIASLQVRNQIRCSRRIND